MRVSSIAASVMRLADQALEDVLGLEKLRGSQSLRLRLDEVEQLVDSVVHRLPS